jgi:5-methylcytosine-specific restriction endonuclease McrA
MSARNKQTDLARLEQWRIENPDRAAAAAIRNRERAQEARRLLREAERHEKAPASLEKKKARDARFRAVHKEELRQAKAKWRTANRISCRAHRAAYRARKRNAEGNYTAADIADLLTRQKETCAGCQKAIPRGFHIDHIKPLSKSGSNHITNLQLLCGPCNRLKGDKFPYSFTP